ncbi:dTDP-4-dehydrorhamnose 3,5-epimerase family protein [Micromonospora endophytica]|uniref:dTDP-4-dehydrorhamnose 3,5-epimerase n=1 Tax=Micromonospora endophytica TaxID=515350 RepID=A0A2W2CTP6_9ACTN|nr:dTDP-4-dehydrorhamnose 3,5-epimerase family protein [Micromonospora endophytica]PZG01231.1 dTDP-4-dehydrorhamnose 3,5-epimerase [Micromonospora endophytica]RIW45887.1 dTDP-4-keto-6-deoxy-D-glucose epimerase [Micromonospora endophytica]
MQIRELKVEGAYELTPQSFHDHRGLFLSPYQQELFLDHTGHRLFPVAQCSLSRSHRAVARGIHFTATPPGMAKFVYSAQGRALDIIVDTRVGAPTYGQWDSVLLDQRDFRALYLPVGVGHLFVSLADDTVVCYLLSTEYVPANELAISPTDPRLRLPLPTEFDLVLSERDRTAPTLDEAERAGILPDYAACRQLSLAWEAA